MKIHTIFNTHLAAFGPLAFIKIDNSFTLTQCIRDRFIWTHKENAYVRACVRAPVCECEEVRAHTGLMLSSKTHINVMSIRWTLIYGF